MNNLYTKLYPIGTKIHIVEMKDEPQYSNKEGIIKSFDSLGQIHGTWGSLAINPKIDEFYPIWNKNFGELEENDFLYEDDEILEKITY